jgi:2-dehydropantoate 2-reductase
MRALVVGAGAVGQVFGYHLHLGGADVSFLVKPKYAGECRAGFTLYPLNDRRRRLEPRRFTGAGVVTTDEEVAASRWDQVFLTVSSTALRGPWLPGLARAAGDATVVSLQPGIEDRTHVLQYVPEDRLVSGLISLIAYAAPLPGETRFPEPGMAYWFPPLSPSPFSGPRARVDAVVAALRAGGQPAKRHPDVPGLAGFPSAIMMPYLVALEAGGWTFDRLGQHAPTAARAAREAVDIVAARPEAGRRPPLIGLAVRPFVVRAGLWLGRKVIPLDLETYLREHFIKVGDQTRLMMSQYIDHARSRGLPSAALESLNNSIAALPGTELASSRSP